jgi:hypothetical protein
MDQELLSDTFVELADTMVADFDVIDLLHLLTDRSVQLLGASATRVMLADPRGHCAWSPPPAKPSACWRCSSSKARRDPAWRPSAPGSRDRTRPETRAATLATVHPSCPAGRLHLRERPPDAAARTSPRRPQPVPRPARPFDPADLRIGQALADTATIGLLHERNLRRAGIVSEQLQVALNSRVGVTLQVLPFQCSARVPF